MCDIAEKEKMNFVIHFVKAGNKMDISNSNLSLSFFVCVFVCKTLTSMSFH